MLNILVIGNQRRNGEGVRTAFMPLPADAVAVYDSAATNLLGKRRWPGSRGRCDSAYRIDEVDAGRGRCAS